MHKITLISSLIILGNIILQTESINPFGVLKTCITDSQCKNHEDFCDHTGINPIGTCRAGYPNGAKCTFDRHCRSKNCSSRRCVGRKPVKDGPCSKDQHIECIDSQYCSSRSDSGAFMCRDRSYSGACVHSEQCLSRKCLFFKCRRPKDESGKPLPPASQSVDPNLVEYQQEDLEEQQDVE